MRRSWSGTSQNQLAKRGELEQIQQAVSSSASLQTCSPRLGEERRKLNVKLCCYDVSSSASLHPENGEQRALIRVHSTAKLLHKGARLILTGLNQLKLAQAAANTFTHHTRELGLIKEALRSIFFDYIFRYKSARHTRETRGLSFLSS